MRKVTKRVTVEDVARLAGVSISAVSRAFSPDPGGLIKEAKRERVIEAAQKLGYRPNAFARSLRTTRTKLVGILLEEFENPLFLRVLDTLTRKLQELGFRALAINASKDISLADAISLVLEYRIEALIVSSDIPLRVEYECQRMNVPIFVFGRSDKKRAGVIEFCIDDEEAGRLAAHHLADCGYIRPAFVGGFPDVSVTIERLRGFTLGLAERGLKLAHSASAGDNTYGSALSVASTILGHKSRPDAVFCVNDQVAIAVVDCARAEFGLDVPQSLGVMGVDNLWFGATKSYSLTTIEQPIAEMAGALAASVGALADRAATNVASRSFHGKVLVRSTTIVFGKIDVPRH